MLPTLSAWLLSRVTRMRGKNKADDGELVRNAVFPLLSRQVYLQYKHRYGTVKHFHGIVKVDTYWYMKFRFQKMHACL